MKILIAAGIFPPDIGGPAIYSSKLASELTRRNFRVKVVSYGGRKRDLPKGIKHLVYFFQILFNTLYADVVYAQNATSAGLPAIVAAKILGKKFVLKIVGDAAWERARETNATDDRLLAFQRKQYSRGIELLRKAQKLVARKADCIIVPSFYLKSIVELWGISDEKIHVIYNAAFPSQSAKFLDISIHGDVILSIGRLVPWKGFGELIAIMPELLKANPSFKLFIIGSGPLFEDLQYKIVDSGLSESVKLMGSLQHENLSAYFKAAEIFVLNSSYEGFSHVILEAMAYGVPIIATNAGGNPELIEDGVNGFLVKVGNSRDLIGKILKLHSDASLRNTFVINSKSKLKEFSFENMMEKTIQALSLK